MKQTIPRHRLIIMRHAKSDWASEAMSDFDRPLNKRGERDAPLVGRWLKDQNLIPDRLVSSPANRAKETARLVAAEMGFVEAAIVWVHDIYEAALPILLKVVETNAKGARTLMLVGHNPGFEQLLMHFARKETLPEVDKRMPTAGVYVLEFPDDSEKYLAGKGICIAHMRPRWLT
jgi:phosphohistidine phosphatase